MIQLGLKINKFSVVPRTVLRGFAIIVLFLAIPLFAQGAILYLEPSQAQYQSGDTFIVKIKIDTEDECINTVSANLSFPQDVLKAVDFNQGQSILTFWVKPPEINQESGLISFSGGIPGGYCGILPGDSGESNLLGGIIFRVIPRPISLSSAEIIFRDDSQVLLNDGLGTSAKLTIKETIFTILPGEGGPPKNEWLEKLEEDKIPPEPFEVEVHQEPTIFEGKYFIIFSTTDKQTGLDYYEVKEGKEDWQKTTSPYLLKDQKLRGIIKVKAVDKAGNERVAKIIPPKKQALYWIIILILIGAGITWWIIAKPRKTL